LKVQVGDAVVYREFGGGRWSFNGVKVLLTAATDILAVVEGGNLR
jgi:co-chaperonin GroES (HSP10)